MLAARPSLAADDFAGFNVGVQSYTFRNFDLEQMLKKTKELGLKNAEFYSKHIPTDSSADKLKAILKLCEEYEVKPVGFGVSGFSKNHDANKKLFDFGKAIGVKYLMPTRRWTASTASTSCARSTRSRSRFTRTGRRGRGGTSGGQRRSS